MEKPPPDPAPPPPYCWMPPPPWVPDPRLEYASVVAGTWPANPPENPRLDAWDLGLPLPPPPRFTNPMSSPMGAVLVGVLLGTAQGPRGVPVNEGSWVSG